MNDVNLMDAFASYKVKPARLARSAMTPDGDLVISCWYIGFKKAAVGILSYEEDLSGQTSKMAMALRVHLVEALSSECGIRVIVAVGTRDPKADPAVIAPTRTTYYARKDLVGRVSSFDGERFVVEFKRAQTPAQGRLTKGALLRRNLTRRTSDSSLLRSALSASRGLNLAPRAYLQRPLLMLHFINYLRARWWWSEPDRFRESLLNCHNSVA